VNHLKGRGVLEGESVEDNFTPFLIPVGGPLSNPGRGRVLLAGDAGGFVNAVTAEGIYYAMVSGDLAAETVIATRPGGEAAMAARYAKACEQEIGPELRDSVRIQRYLFANRGRIRHVIDGAHREKAITALVLDFIVGKMPYRTLKRRMLTKAPRLAVRVVWERLRHGHHA
jgi:flavin-dependent dehydrogenase